MADPHPEAAVAPEQAEATGAVGAIGTKNQTLIITTSWKQSVHSRKTLPIRSLKSLEVSCRASVHCRHCIRESLPWKGDWRSSKRPLMPARHWQTPAGETHRDSGLDPDEFPRSNAPLPKRSHSAGAARMGIRFTRAQSEEGQRELAPRLISGWPNPLRSPEPTCNRFGHLYRMAAVSHPKLCSIPSAESTFPCWKPLGPVASKCWLSDPSSRRRLVMPTGFSHWMKAVGPLWPDLQSAGCWQKVSQGGRSVCAAAATPSMSDVKFVCLLCELLGGPAWPAAMDWEKLTQTPKE